MPLEINGVEYNLKKIRILTNRRFELAKLIFEETEQFEKKLKEDEQKNKAKIKKYEWLIGVSEVLHKIEFAEEKLEKREFISLTKYNELLKKKEIGDIKDKENIRFAANIINKERHFLIIDLRELKSELKHTKLIEKEIKKLGTPEETDEMKLIMAVDNHIQELIKHTDIELKYWGRPLE